MMLAQFSGNPLPGKVLTLWRLSTLCAAAVLIAMAICAGFLWWPGPLSVLVATLFSSAIVVNVILETSFLLRLRHRAYRYEDAHGFLRFRTGYLFARHVVIPADQILYVDLQQGPLARRLGLCKVNVGTLGSVHTLGPVEEGRAQEISEKYGGARRRREA